jgi:hypothetical protein
VTDLVVFPDGTSLAHKVLKQGMAERVLDIQVGSKIPSPMPARFILCYALPGRETCRRVQWCQVIAYVYDDAQHEVRCGQTAQIVAAILRAAPDMVIDGEQWITEPVEKHGPFPSQDPDLPNVPRYQVNLTWTLQSRVI